MNANNYGNIIRVATPLMQANRLMAEVLLDFAGKASGVWIFHPGRITFSALFVRRVNNTLLAVDDNFIVIITIRSDSFSQLQSEQRLAEISRLPFDLPRLSPGAFKEVIEGPGKLATPEITIDPALTDRLKDRNFKHTYQVKSLTNPPQPPNS